MSGKLRLFSAEVKVPLWHWIAASLQILVVIVGLIVLCFGTDAWQVHWIVVPAVALGAALPVGAGVWPRVASLFRSILTVLLLAVFPIAAGLLVSLITPGAPHINFPWELFVSLSTATALLAAVWVLMRTFEGSNAREQRQLDKRIMQHHILIAAEPVVSVAPYPYPAAHEA